MNNDFVVDNIENKHWRVSNRARIWLTQETVVDHIVSERVADHVANTLNRDTFRVLVFSDHGLLTPDNSSIVLTILHQNGFSIIAVNSEPVNQLPVLTWTLVRPREPNGGSRR